MRRKQRTEILIDCDIEKLEEMAKIIETKHNIEILEEPNSGLIMVKMRESAQKHLFYLGEVFVTECKVMLDGVIGLGIIKGAHKKRANYLAIIDAAYNAKVRETKDLDLMIKEEKLKIDEKKALICKQILKTKVDFETLDEEVKA